MENAIVRVKRFDPSIDPAPYIEEYTIAFRQGFTVMDALYEIYSTMDSTLAFRASCMHGWCNVCAVKVNGKSVLPCQEAMEKEMLVEPVANLEVVRDLIVLRKDAQPIAKTGPRCPCATKAQTSL